MYGKSFFKTVDILTRLGHQFGSSYISVDLKKQRLMKTTDPKVISRVNRNYNLLGFWCIASFLLVVKFYFSGNKERYNLTLFFWLGGFTFCVIFSILRWFTFEFCRSMNAMILLFQSIQVKYMPDADTNSSRFSTILEILIKITTAFGASMVVLVILFCLYDPRGVIFLAAWIPLDYYTYFPIGILFTLFHSYLTICTGFNMIITASFVITYLYSLARVYTKELYLGRKQYDTLNILRSNPRNLMHVFRSIQILNSNVMCWVGMFMIYFHSVCMLLPILGNFVLISCWEDLVIVGKLTIATCAWGLFVFWSVVLQLGKYLFVRGDRILWSWKGVSWGTKRDNRIMTKFRKSCKPVVIQNGNLLVFARITQFKYMKGVVRGTFRSLLTLARKL